MLDVTRRQFELRKNFKMYGIEDRSRYKYQGDLFNIYSNKNNEFLFKYGFVNETISESFFNQNLNALIDTNLDKSSKKIKELYNYLFEEELSKIELDRLSVSTNLQVEILCNSIENKKTILEFGPGNGLVGPFF